jgi:sulfotransferase 6B1
MSGILSSAPARKAAMLANKIPRTMARWAAQNQDYERTPPIIVNSLPKSGTHLLLQVARALPKTRYFGSFIAQTPSLTLRLRSQHEISQSIAAIVPGEVVGAHLYYSPATAQAIADKNALHLFIWRDPRDVLISEAHYLAEMNRFHAMHRAFRACSSQEARVNLALEPPNTPLPATALGPIWDGAMIPIALRSVMKVWRTQQRAYLNWNVYVTPMHSVPR